MRAGEFILEGTDDPVSELRSALLAKKEKLQSSTEDQIYDIIDGMMTQIAKSHGISAHKLHELWVSKYKKIPDAWIMQKNLKMM